MTDATLATYAVVANEIENEARALLAAGESELVEASAVVRQAVALRVVLEKWIVARAIRSAGDK
jgi:hypothetical protein